MKIGYWVRSVMHSCPHNTIHCPTIHTTYYILFYPFNPMYAKGGKCLNLHQIDTSIFTVNRFSSVKLIQAMKKDSTMPFPLWSWKCLSCTETQADEGGFMLDRPSYGGDRGLLVDVWTVNSLLAGAKAPNPHASISQSLKCWNKALHAQISIYFLDIYNLKGIRNFNLL